MTSDQALVQYRNFGFDLEDMEPLHRADGGDGREVIGIAVPYNVEQLIYPGLIERFVLGSFAHQIRAIPQRAHFALNHMAQGGQIIGKIRQAEETARGLRVFMRISQTSTGDDTLTLVNDEALRHLSIGFIPRSIDKPDDRGVTTRKKADLTEVAIVPEGAYGNAAKISAVRSIVEADNRDAARQALAHLPLVDMIC